VLYLIYCLFLPTLRRQEHIDKCNGREREEIEERERGVSVRKYVQVEASQSRARKRSVTLGTVRLPSAPCEEHGLMIALAAHESRRS